MLNQTNNWLQYQWHLVMIAQTSFIRGPWYWQTDNNHCHYADTAAHKTNIVLNENISIVTDRWSLSLYWHTVVHFSHRNGDIDSYLQLFLGKKEEIRKDVQLTIQMAKLKCSATSKFLTHFLERIVFKYSIFSLEESISVYFPEQDPT